MKWYVGWVKLTEYMRWTQLNRICKMNTVNGNEWRGSDNDMDIVDRMKQMNEIDSMNGMNEMYNVNGIKGTQNMRGYNLNRNLHTTSNELE